MRKKMLPLFAPTLLLLAAMLAGCNKDETDANQLPDGKHPLTLTATMEGLTATRSTVDGAWDGTEKVAVQIGSVVKQYTANTSGNLTATNPHYWQSTANINVSAWIPYSATKPDKFEVKADQSGDGYAQSDMLWSSKEISYVGNSALEFKHLPAKVVVNLKKGEGVTESEVQNATVTLVSQNLTSGTIGANWTVTATTTGNSEIKTNVLTTPTTDFQKTVQALVVPQQMQNKQFIKVTIGTGTAARDYSYTTADDANLESGTQYTYAITVKKNELVVSKVDASIGWGNGGSLGEGTAEASTYRVTMPSGNIPTVTIIGATKKTGEAYYEVNKNATTVTISYTFSDYKDVKGFSVVQGFCNVKRTVSDDTYTLTYTNIRSDLKLAYDIYCQLGDFYCKDANGNAYFIPGDATLTDAQKTACLGIVYWVGDITGDNYGLLNSKFPVGTHGLVACKQVLADPDNTNQLMTWTYGGLESVNAWLATDAWTGPDRPTNFTSIQHEQRMQGYANTVALQKYNTAVGSTSNLRAKPIVALATFAGIASNSAPGSSSGWYWPSFYELEMMCWGQGNTGGSRGREMLNAKFDMVSGQLFSESPTWGYWSSTECSAYSASNAWYVRFDNGYVEGVHRTFTSYPVRPVLAF